MSATRDASAFLHIGAKKTGKTTETLAILDDMWTQQGKPCLILNIGNQAEYNSFEEITVGELYHFNAWAKEVDDPFFQIKTFELDRFFRLVSGHIRNAAIVLEDATSYAAGNLSKPFKEMLLANRNSGNDLFINLHSLRDPAPFLFMHAEYIILRQTSDDPDRLPSKVLAPDKVAQAMYEIRAENERDHHRFAHRLISLQEL